MTAIADQSTMTIWPAWVWALGMVVLALGLLVVGLCRAAAKPTPQPEFEASAYNAPTVKPRCAVPFCDDEVTVHKRIGYETWTFCLEHGLPYLRNEVA